MTSGNDNLEKIFSSCMLALERDTEERSIPDILKKGTTQNIESELYLRIGKKVILINWVLCKIISPKKHSQCDW